MVIIMHFYTETESIGTSNTQSHPDQHKSPSCSDHEKHSRHSDHEKSPSHPDHTRYPDDDKSLR